MTKKNITYPQYRKYSNNRSFFKIISSEEFEEIKLNGNKAYLHFFKAKILPDRNFIYDLTFDFDKHWLKIDANEYEEIKNSIKE